MKNLLLVLLGFIVFSVTDLYSQQLVYRPTNPSFGGNPLYGSFLLSEAQQQDKLTDGSESSAQDPLQEFKDQLNRNILNQISRQLVEQVFGTSGDLQEGTFEIGDFIINIGEGTSGISIQILDLLTGNETNIIIPNP